MHHSNFTKLHTIFCQVTLVLTLLQAASGHAQTAPASPPEGPPTDAPGASQNPVPAPAPPPSQLLSTPPPSSAPASAPSPGTTPVYPAAHDPAPTASAPPAPAAAPAPPSAARPVDPERAAKLQRLRERRAQVSLGVPIALSATGIAFFAVAASTGIEALLYSDAGNCEGYDGAPDCLRHRLVWGLGGASIASGVIGITLLSIGLPKLFHAFGERRALGQEMRTVSNPKLPTVAFDLGQHRAGLTLRARY